MLHAYGNRTVVVLRNDYKVKDAIVCGRRWVMQDIADAVAIAIRDKGKKWNSRKIILGSLNQYTVSDDVGCLTGCVNTDGSTD